jgi:hypothetical protein
VHTTCPLGGGDAVGAFGGGGGVDALGGGRDALGEGGDAIGALGGGGGGDVSTGVVLFMIETSAQFQNSSGIEYSPHAGRFPLSPGGRHEFPVTHHHHRTQLGHS